jgi:hypothetical protein
MPCKKWLPKVAFGGTTRWRVQQKVLPLASVVFQPGFPKQFGFSKTLFLTSRSGLFTKINDKNIYHKHSCFL